MHGSSSNYLLHAVGLCVHLMTRMSLFAQVQDKVAFHVNNLSTSNLAAKAGDIKKALTPESWPWFANYMVVKRAAQEPNFHGLYIEVRGLPTCGLTCTARHPCKSCQCLEWVSLPVDRLLSLPLLEKGPGKGLETTGVSLPGSRGPFTVVECRSTSCGRLYFLYYKVATGPLMY